MLAFPTLHPRQAPLTPAAVFLSRFLSVPGQFLATVISSHE
jgi:hypothetical protein